MRSLTGGVIGFGGSACSAARQAWRSTRTIQFRMTVVLAGLLLPFVILLAALGWGRSDESSLLVFAPFLLWAVTIPAAWYVADQQVGRHLRRLARVAQACATGETPLALAPEAPAEILALAESLREVAGRIAGHERQLHEAIESQDAMVREVHHRVKNNLQTISALLRLQARRLPPGVGRVALFEAERRVRSIAIVHEILSRDPSDQVPFDEIVTSLIRMAEDSVVSSVDLTFSVVGELGEVPADVATPLAVVLAELLQNAVEHAFVETEADDADRPDRMDTSVGAIARVGEVSVHLASDDQRLTVEVSDDGSGLPEDFDFDTTGSLGLSIVRDLVRTQIGGTIAMQNRSDIDPTLTGTVVSIELPVREAPRLG